MSTRDSGGVFAGCCADVAPARREESGGGHSSNDAVGDEWDLVRPVIVDPGDAAIERNSGPATPNPTSPMTSTFFLSLSEATGRG
jgi:hypothetical protein